jgi:hypothetical protein
VATPYPEPGTPILRSATYLPRQPAVVNQPRWTFIRLFAIRSECLGENDHALPWNLVLFEKFTEDDLGFAVRVDIGSVERLRESALTSM